MKRYLLFIILFLFSLSCLAQEIETQIDKPQQVFIGTPIDIYVKITLAPEDTVYTTVKDSLDIFILQGEIFETEEILEDKKIINQKLTYQPFHTGEYTFPALEYAVKTNSGMKFLETSEFQVNVQSVLPDSAQVIKDIADPLKINLGFWDYALPVILLIMLFFLIRYLLLYLKRSKAVGSDSKKPKVIRPAWQIALEQLQELKASNLLEQGDFINYHFRLSLILRIFLELEYKIKAAEMTTSEIRSELNLPDKKEKSAVLEFLSKSDRIKFAKFPTDRAESYTATEWLYKYLISYKEKTMTRAEEDKHV